MKPDGLQPDKLLSRLEVEQEFGISKRFLEIAAVRGDGPPMVKLSKRMVRYRPRDIVSWLDSRTVQSTSEESSEVPRG